MQQDALVWMDVSPKNHVACVAVPTASLKL